jgi:CubicO group peptidase (beta-lactamase class C family)
MGQINQDLLRDAVVYADQWVAYQQERRDIPGVVVAIQSGDQILLAHGYGYADLERQIPMTAAHIFRIASHSKTFTATAILQLLEAGKLRLDDPLANSIPWLQPLGDLARVTVRQALNHTTGIVRDGDNADYWSLDYAFPDRAELQRLVEEGGRVLAPNESFKYSNIAYALLGLVIEAASGLPYNQYVKREIVDRLGLADTGPEIDAHARARLAVGYTARRFGLPRRPLAEADTRALSAATGFYATAPDLCRYAAAHCFGDETLLSDASKREMQQPYWKADQGGRHYGLGFVVDEVAGRRLVGHSGGFPGYITLTLIDPVDRLAVVALTNDAAGPAQLLGHGLVKLIQFALKQPPAPEGSAGSHARFTGRFANNWGVTDVAAFGDSLFVLNPDFDDPVAEVTQLAVEDDQTLRITATSGFAAPGETIRYQRDAAGNITRIIRGGMSAYPLPIFLARQSGA